MTTTVEALVLRVTPEGREFVDDAVAIEEPLEIRVAWGPGAGTSSGASITMRTPGDDLDLAVGFLYAEGVLRTPDEVEGLWHYGSAVREDGTSNIVKVQLRADTRAELPRLGEGASSSSSYGSCSKAALDAARASRPLCIEAGPVMTTSLIQTFPRRARRDPSVSSHGGGLHVAALFGEDGRMLRIREDIGAHNAAAKVIGADLRAGLLPRPSSSLYVNSRASLELVQRTAMAGIPILVTVGAPSSMAVSLATRSRMTLLGFSREGRLNIYSGADRIDNG